MTIDLDIMQNKVTYQYILIFCIQYCIFQNYRTAAFLIPLINRLLQHGYKGKGKEKSDKFCYPKALILSPTRELAQQTFREVLKLAYRTPILPALVYGGQDNFETQLASLKSGCDILVATPLRLINMMKNINLSECTFLVLDESDRLLDNNFAQQTKKIISILPPKDKRTTVMFSATHDKNVVGLVEDFLKYDHVSI
uniref:ATP-dependent RNA helicase n=1 Tax=Meloidogyne incognita TaxID=6306 RepID=A0A914KXM7_MELIC